MSTNMVDLVIFSKGAAKEGEDIETSGYSLNPALFYH